MANAQNNGEMGQSNGRSILEAQQLFAETICFENEITWDLTPEDQPDTLKLKIDNITKDPEVREAMFNSVWAQRKYTNKQSLTSLIFVMVAIDKTNEEQNIAAESRSNWSCHPVYRTRRCTSDNLDSNSSFNCCMIFVDENGRVYQNWDAYLANNQLPAGIMVAPARGIYTLIDGIVLLENCLTPAASPRGRTLQKLDGAIGVGGVLACSLLMLPVAAPIIAAAGVVSVSCVSYATARSSVNLVNRSIHEQSISVKNRSARKDWVAVVGGTVALCATVANRVLARPEEHKIKIFNEHAVNGFNISCIIISGAGIANGAFDLYLKKRDDAAISAMDVLQLSASLVIFTHSVYNFKLASTIIRESRNQHSFHVHLQKRQRSIYEQLSTVTRGNGGANRGAADNIRNVNGMRSPQELNDPTIWENYGGLAINGLKVALTHYGPLVMDRITDGDNIDSVLSYLRKKIPNDLQKFVLKLANMFIKFFVKQIESRVQFYISTESVIYTIASQLLKKYAGYDLNQLEEMIPEILNDIKKYYWAQNPICFTSKIIKCEVCGGQYNYCDL